MTDPRQKIAGLSPEKLARFAQRLSRDRPRSRRPEIEPRARDGGALPLSFAQQRLWFLHQLDPGGTAYNILSLLRLPGPPCFAAVEESLHRVVRRHEILRTTYGLKEGRGCQDVHDGMATPVAVVDLGNLETGLVEKEGRKLLQVESSKPFDLQAGPLLRCLLLLHGEEFSWAFCYHHIVSDWWSAKIFYREVMHYYEELSAPGDRVRELPEPSLQYADYAVWERGHLTAALDGHLEAMVRRLAPAAVETELPADRPRPREASGTGGKVKRVLSDATMDALRSWTQRRGATTFMGLLAALKLVLWRSSGGRGITVGSAISNRERKEVQGILGFFVNTLVFYTPMDGAWTGGDLLKAVKESCLATFAHQDLPFERLVEAVAPERSAGVNPLFQVMFGLEKDFTISERTETSRSLAGTETAEDAPLPGADAKFDLTLQVLERPSRSNVEIEYNADLFDPATARRLGGHLERALELLAGDPRRPISSLSFMSRGERHQALVEWGGDERRFPSASSIPEIFREQAARWADAEALCYEREGTEPETWTYRTLDERTEAGAAFLLSRGVAVGGRVGILLPAGAPFVAAQLAVLKAGAAFVPLDPKLPAARLHALLEDTGLERVITEESLAKQLPEAVHALGAEDLFAPAPAPGLPRNLDPSLPAYVMYTSGSTGRPKGIEISQRAVVRLVKETDFLQLGPGDRVAQVALMAFDAATFEVWGPLLNGGTVVGAGRDLSLEPEAFAAWLQDRRVDSLFLTTALFRLIGERRPRAFAGLRDLLVGGQSVDPRWIRRVQRAGGPRRLLNVYGPTECTTFATWYEVPEVSPGQTAVPIGGALANTAVFVADPRLEPAVLGSPGELLLGGPGLASGYVGQPALTAAVFVPDPWGPEAGSRLYRTGDLVRRGHDGALTFLGRRDHQVKIRGFRIEPGEIEAVLQSHGAVRAATVLALGRGEETTLSAYLEMEAPATGSGTAVTAAELRDFLSRTLPEYMVPASFSLLDGFPLTPTGKVDRRALAELETEAPAAADYRPPSTELEETLITLWQEVLEVDRVGVEDDFFALGGHSLLATRLVARLRQELHQELPLRAFFENPTPRALAEAMEGRPEEAALAWPKADRSEPLPLSYAQQRLWFLYRLEPESAAYNMPEVMRLEGAVDAEALEATLARLVQRHEALRTRFVTLQGEPFQVVDAEPGFRLEVADLEDRPEEERRERAVALLNDAARRPFDLENGPVFRALLVRLGEEGGLLLLNMHHVVSDGWSMRLLATELRQVHGALAEGREPRLEPLEYQYADYALWQRDWLADEEVGRQKEYWKRQLAPPLPLLELPTDFSRPPVQTFEGAVESRWLDGDLTQALEGLGRRESATLFMTLLAGFFALLGRYSGQRDLVLGVPVANRRHRETEGIVGFFVNTLVLRGDLSGDPSFRALLGRVREATLGAYDHQDFPFEMLVDELRVERDLSRNPIFQVLFDFHSGLGGGPSATGDPAVPPAEGGSLSDGAPDVEIDNAICDLSLSAFEVDGRLLLGAQYSTSLFTTETVARLLGHLEALLRGAVAEPEQPVRRIDLLTSLERRQQLTDPHGAAPPWESRRLVTERLRRRAQATPDAVAVEAGEDRLTYRALQELSGIGARRLRALGVGPEVAVGVALGRRGEMVAALFAVLRAGGGYVPLDPEDPEARRRFLLSDSQPALILVDEATAGAFGGTPEVALRELFSAAGEEAGGAADLPLPAPGSAAYRIYTSGSSGRPKGVVISHEALGRYVDTARESLGLTAEDRVLQCASLSFDVTVEEIFPTLAAGGTVVIAEQVKTLDFPELEVLLEERGITSLELPTHYWSEWVGDLERRGAEPPATLRTVIIGTERPLPQRLERWRAFRPRLRQVYGLTEATVTSLVHPFSARDGEIDEGFKLPIGRPVAGTRAYLLDGLGQPLPRGVVGEIFIGGDVLARGYGGRPGLTASRFLPDPWGREAGARRYRTGDLGRYLPNGEMIFLGRRDTQVKIRGYRVEAGEVEAALAEHRAVRECVVVVREDEPGDKRLVAYWTAAEETLPAVEELRRHLAGKLPEYMCPELFVHLEEMPATATGKLDPRALPAPSGERPELTAAFTAPRGELEKAISEIWCQTLRLERVGIHDNFFDLGGNSLLIAQVHARIRDELGLELTLVDLFTAPTIAAAAASLSGGAGAGTAPRAPRGHLADTAVAVIGVAGRFSGSRSLKEFWDKVVRGVDSVQRFSRQELLEAGVDPEVLELPDYVPVKGRLPDADLFDAAFFGIPPREAEVLDPQHRILLEASWEALEEAGYDAAQYGGRIGIYAGASPNYYCRENLIGNPQVDNVDPLKVELGNVSDFLPLRVAYHLGLDGPTINVQSACSTSLTAIAQAYFSLLSGQCDMALAGGVSVLFPQVSGYFFHESNIWSEDGRCRSFDASASGLVIGEGVGVVALKRLPEAEADGDHIYAVIKGAAIRNEGSAKVGFAAPGVEGQAEMVRSALEMARVDPRSIGLLEAHGSATLLGDPAEVAGLSQAFEALGGGEVGYCALGSVKTNIGHADIAAGVAGFLKATLALRDETIPPSLHFEEPNPELRLEESPFYIPTDQRSWKRGNGTPRRAGVSSLGVGGTNTHMVLEEAPEVDRQRGSEPKTALLILSARSEAALDRRASDLAAFLDERPETSLGDLAWTLGVGRRPFEHRRALVVGSVEQAVAALRGELPGRSHGGLLSQTEKRPSVVFLFSPPGAQYPGMGRGLYEGLPIFRRLVDRGAEFLRESLGLDLRELLYPDPESGARGHRDLDRPRFAQPALLLTASAMAEQWRAWGVEPTAMIGHGMGEYAAARAAGVMTLEESLLLVAARGRLLEELPAGAGTTVFLPGDEVEALLPRGASIAAIDSPYSCVASGTPESIEALEETLARRGADFRRLRSAHAFLPDALEPLRQGFRAEVAGVRLRAPEVPYISNLTGDWITEEQATSPEYWVDQLVGTVHFAQGVRRVLEGEGLCLLEVGPGRALTTLTRQQVDRRKAPTLLTSIRRRREDRGDLELVTGSLGRLWLAGATPRWNEVFEGPRRRLALPTYPFEGQRFFIEAPQRREPVQPVSQAARLVKNPQIEDWFYAPSWRRTAPLLEPSPGRVAALPREGAADSPEVPAASPREAAADSSEVPAASPREAAADSSEGPAGERAADSPEVPATVWEPPGWLIFEDDHGVGSALGDRLEAQGDRVFRVRLGTGFSELEEGRYTLHAGRLADYMTLFEEIRESGAAPRRLVHCWGITAGEEVSPSAIQDRGLHSLLHVVQAIDFLGLEGDAALTVVTDGMQKVVEGGPLHGTKATVLGLCRVLSQEHPNLGCHSVDVEVPAVGSRGRERRLRRLARDLAAEGARSERELAVAYRGGHRWRQVYEPIPLAADLESKTALRQGGVYLMTGGQGFVGFELSALLAAKYQARIALVGYRPLPPEEVWEAYLEEHRDDDDKTAWKIRRLRAIRESGAEVLLLCADAGDREALERAFEETEEAFGPIDGVFHAAGITDETHYFPIKETTPQGCAFHLRPKVEGLRVLEEILEQRSVDFCLIFSSIASVLGGLSFVTYTAANAVLDLEAQRLNEESDSHWVSVNWDGWLVEGLEEAAAEAEEGSLLSLAMTLEEGLAATERVLARKDLAQVAVSTGDLEVRIDRWVRLSALQREGDDPQPRAGESHSRPHLANPYVAPRSELEGQIAEVWQELLGIEEVGVHDNFFELGGDSLLAVHLSSRLLDRVGVEISGGRLLAAQTVVEQSVAVIEEMTAGVDEGELAALLGEGDGSSP